MWAKCGLVAIGPVADEHLDLAVECRANNSDLYLQGDPGGEASRRWIQEHRGDERDTLLSITYGPERLFFGTLGYTIRDDWADVGRIGLYTPTLRRLLARGISDRALSKVVDEAATLLIKHLFSRWEVGCLQAEVMANNQYSIGLCRRLGFREDGEPTPDGMLRFLLDRVRYLRSQEIHCLFFQHNMIETTHHAIGDFLETMQGLGVRYRFAAKRTLHNEVFAAIGSPNVELLCDMSLAKQHYRDLDLMHVVYDGKPSLSLCSIAYVYDIPYLLTFHGGDDTNRKIFEGSVRSRTVELANHADAVTVVCHKDEQTLRKLGVTSDIIITPPAIRRYPVMVSHTRDHHAIAVVGRMVPKKGIGTAIRALHRLPGEYTLDVIGDGPMAGQLRQLAHDQGVDARITWHGLLPIEQMIEVLRRDGILWHPATTGPDGNAEGVPQVLIYGMAERMLVVSTRSGHIAELIDDGGNGLLVDPDDPEALARVTLGWSDHPGRLIDGAERSARAYDIDVQATRWLKLYQRLRRRGCNAEP